MMKNWGLVSKMLVFTSTLLFALTSLGYLMFLKSESDMLRDMSDEYRQKITRSIKEQEVAETEALHENVLFNAQVLSEIAAVHLYNYDGEGIRQNLQTYMKYPDIVRSKLLTILMSRSRQPGTRRSMRKSCRPACRMIFNGTPISAYKWMPCWKR